MSAGGEMSQSESTPEPTPVVQPPDADVAAWLNSTEKPDWMKGHPVASQIVAVLIIRQADTHSYIVSHDTLAQACCCGVTHIKDELDFLVEKKWVTKTRGRRFANG
jgi:hypothetical protein